METITLTNSHGKWETDGYHLDERMRRHLPASPNDLHRELSRYFEGSGLDFSDVHYVSELLIILASFDYGAEQNQRAADRVARDAGLNDLVNGSTRCDECQAAIPDAESSEVNANHERSCSLHPANSVQ